MRINIRTENEAFVGNEETELSRILREIADKIEEGNRPRKGTGRG